MSVTSLRLIISLITLLRIATIVSSSDCEYFIDELLEKVQQNDLDSLTPEEEFTLKYSAHKPYSLGNRALCTEDVGMTFMVALSTGEDRGLCLPIACQVSELSANPSLARKVYEIHNWPISAVRPEPRILDPIHGQGDPGVMFYITILLFAFFILTSIVCTVIGLWKDRSRKEGNPPSGNQHRLKTHWGLKAFDIIEGLKSLWQTAKEQNQDDNISVFGFLRTFAMLWVCLYHAKTKVVHLVNDDQYGEKFGSSFTRIVVDQGQLPVDLFFTMGGFFGALMLIPRIQKGGSNIKSYFHCIQHRFLRTWPMIMMSLLFYWFVMEHINKGMFWWKLDELARECDGIGWRKIFMIDNLVLTNHGFKYCMVWQWYLAADLQIYCALTVVIGLYLKNRKGGYFLALFLVIQGFTLGLYNCIRYNIKYWNFGLYYFEKFYYLPYVRWTTFFIGAIFGMMYYEYKKLKMTKNNFFAFCEDHPRISYLFAALGVGALLFGAGFIRYYQFHPGHWSDALRSAWTLLNRQFMAVTVVLLFMPQLIQKKSWIKSFFNLRLFQICGKLSYAFYIYHEIVGYILLINENDDFISDYHHGLIFKFWVKMALITFAVALITHLTIEKPLLTIVNQLTVKPQQAQPKLEVEFEKLIAKLNMDTLKDISYNESNNDDNHNNNNINDNYAIETNNDSIENNNDIQDNNKLSEKQSVTLA